MAAVENTELGSCRFFLGNLDPGFWAPTRSDPAGGRDRGTERLTLPPLPLPPPPPAAAPAEQKLPGSIPARTRYGSGGRKGKLLALFKMHAPSGSYQGPMWDQFKTQS